MRDDELAAATKRALARWDEMSSEEKTERLKAAGILDENGELAPRYRSKPTTKDENMSQMVPVIIESPFAGDVDRNKAYLEKCIRACALRKESAYASHKMLTEALDDEIEEERDLGIALGFVWHKHAAKSCVYVDHGISKGMWYGIDSAWRAGLRIEVRALYEETDLAFFEALVNKRQRVLAMARADEQPPIPEAEPPRKLDADFDRLYDEFLREAVSIREILQALNLDPEKIRGIYKEAAFTIGETLQNSQLLARLVKNVGRKEDNHEAP